MSFARIYEQAVARKGGEAALRTLLPPLAERARDRHIRLLLRSAKLRDALPPAPNLETQLLPEVALPGRLRFTYMRAAAEARRWNADVYFAAGDLVPLQPRCK